MEALERIERSVRSGERNAILSRWDFGHEVLKARHGSKLPPGLVAQICTAVGISPSELSNRTRMAEHYTRDAFYRKLQNESPTWTALVQALPKGPSRKASPRPTTTFTTSSNPTTGPSKATMVKADRVAALIAEPEVAAELVSRDRTDAATRKAAALVERQARAEAKAEAERAREDEELQRVLRQRLVQGDTDWSEFTALLEVMADTVRRLVDMLDGLPVPDSLRTKVLDKQLSKLQGGLHQLRRRVIPEYVEPVADITSRTRNGVIDTSGH